MKLPDLRRRNFLSVLSSYRAPNFPLTNFIDELNTSISKLPDNIELVILGDFNVDLSSNLNGNRPLRSKLKSLSNRHNLEQLIQSPTRITADKESTIDLIFVNNNYRVTEKGVLNLALSDHCMVYCVIKAGVPKVPPRFIEYRSYKHYDKNLFLQDLRNVDWQPVYDFDDVNDAINTWCNLYTNVADQHAPTKKQRIKGLKTPWMTSYLSNLMHDRDYYHKKAVKSKCENHWSTYRKLRCKVNEEVKKAKSTYYQDCINANKRNPALAYGKYLMKLLLGITGQKMGHRALSIMTSFITTLNQLQTFLTNFLPQSELNLQKKLLK